MAPTKRTKAQIQSDRVEIAQRYLKGQFQREIAEALGLTQVMVSYDLIAIQSEWRDMPQAELSELKAKELAKIDTLERTYWQAWEKSQQSKKTTSTGKDGDKIKLGTRSEERNGNPAYLKGVMDCIDRRCKLLGLDAPTRSEVTGADGKAIDLGLSEGTIDVIKSRILGIDPITTNGNGTTAISAAVDSGH